MRLSYLQYLLSMVVGLAVWHLSATARGGDKSPQATDNKLDPAAVKFFETNIRPVLAERCFSCHGPKDAKGKLRLDSRAALLKGGRSGPAVEPGKPQESLLISAVNHGETLQMPPKTKLPNRAIADLTAWVKMGAPWPDSGPTATPTTKEAGPSFTTEQKSHWAFHAPSTLKIPPVKRNDWVKNPIDAFILAKLEEKGLSPAPPAEPRVLLRRLYFDLIGLPPTPSEVESFLLDTIKNPQTAITHVVDQLLQSPHYGERWGRHWLDVARYADSNGMDENLAFINAHRYRDYVLKSFQDDKPYDQFVREQIAGDLLPATDSQAARQQLTATGFLVLGPKMLAEDDPVKMEMDIIDEQVDAIGRTFMGLTLGCARCHDHKFDPITMADYYGLAGIFKSTKTMENFTVVARWQERPLGGKDAEDQKREHGQRLAAAHKKIADLVQEANAALLKIERPKWQQYHKTAQTLLAQRAERPRLTAALQKTPPDKVPGLILVEAENYTRGNVKKDFATYGPGIGVIYNQGQLPNVAEYDLDVPAAATYQLDLRYAAAESRPVQIIINGAMVQASAAGQVTGTWFPDSQSWAVEGVFGLKAGKNTVRLERAGPFPHFDKLAMFPSSLPSTTPQLTLEQHSQQAKLHPEFLRQWITFIERGGKIPEGTAIDSLLSDPKGPFASNAKLESAYSAATQSALKKLRDELAVLQKAAPAVPEAMAVSDGKITNLRVHLRGSHLTLGKETPRRFPEYLAKEKQQTINPGQSGRLELARWLTQPDHPLTSRVMVNRLWHWHFGAGLVRSTDNFGLLGDRSSQQPLLDWLAVRFVENGWSVKAMHRLIVLSSTYQMSAGWNEKAALIDPENRLHWRMNRRRLEAEAIRDSLLAVSGRLDKTQGGSLLVAKPRQYVTGTANANYERYDIPRRSVYLPVVRSALYDVFQAFDFADPSVPNGERAVTTVAPQALFMMNGKIVLEETQALADSLLTLKENDAARVGQAYLRCYGRPPTEAETARALAFTQRLEESLAKESPTAANHRRRAWQSLCRVLVAANEFIFVE